MKAIRFSKFGGADVLEYVDVEDPVPTGTQLALDVIYAGVNFPDIREREGIHQRSETHAAGITLPRVTGMQAVGIVYAVGPNADKTLVGKKVVSYLTTGGGYAQKAVAESEFSVVVPEKADDKQLAAMLGQGLIAYLMLTKSTRLTPGESILVHGAAGGVGSMAVQIAKILKAGQIIGTAGTEEKRRFVISLGAHNAVDYNSPEWTKEVLAITDGYGVDILLESIGGDMFTQNFECLAPFGRYVIFGSTNGPGDPLPPRRLMTKCQSLTGIYLPVFNQRPDLVSKALKFLVEQTVTGSLRANVAAVVPLSKAAEAHAMMEERKASGMVILDVER